jgi:hypothetical protein
MPSMGIINQPRMTRLPAAEEADHPRTAGLSVPAGGDPSVERRRPFADQRHHPRTTQRFVGWREAIGWMTIRLRTGRGSSATVRPDALAMDDG